MELLEISDIIDTKLGTFDKGISLDEYEKSLYLTSAQTKVYDELIHAFEMNGDLSKDLEPFIEDVSLPVVALTDVGPELSLALYTPNYTLGAGWTFGIEPYRIEKLIVGTGTVASVGVTPLITTMYQVIINVKSISGDTASWTFGGTSGGTISIPGTYSKYITTTSTAGFVLTPTGTNLMMVISSLSIKRVVTRTSIIANSILFELPSNLRKPVYEAAVLSSTVVPPNPLLDGKEVKVIYTKAAELQRKLKNPFREPNYEEVMRVISSDAVPTYDNSVIPQPAPVINSIAELVVPANTTVTAYKVRYISKCTPIVLETLPDDLEIEGVNTATKSKFNTEKLDKIIDIAISLILRDRQIVKSEV
jgi:hypothetical protein